MTAQQVLLLGLMGAGKTAVGRALADRLGCEYVDNDDVVEDIAGRSKASLVESEGEERLRSVESQVVVALLRRPDPFVAGTPAGVVLDPVVRGRLAGRGDGVVLVWLRARVSTLARRLAEDPQDRPWLGDDLAASVAELAAARDPYYAELADLVVDVDELSPEGAAAAIEDDLSRRSPRGA